MSSNDVAIKVKELGKRYEIYDEPGDRLKQFFIPRVRAIFGLKHRQYFKEFWALKNVSFELNRGETLGIIGRNGSGKSTLLQIICGTLNPTHGNVRTHGRVAALLELGSGFNPEFTGKENVYMNAAVLGLEKEEIDIRFDDIVSFADIGDFINQPTKTYSSGMLVRLAFAVIAHVDADILVVDEALAVGDAIFTQKCMRFIREFQKKGTLLFVSHDMGSVLNLCESALWLGNGLIKGIGDSKTVSEEYLQYTQQEMYGTKVSLTHAGITSAKKAPASIANEAIKYDANFTFDNNLEGASGWKTGVAEIRTVVFRDQFEIEKSVFKGGEDVFIEIVAHTIAPLENPIIGFILKDRLGQDIFGENTLTFTLANPIKIAADSAFKAEFRFRLPMLSNGTYSLMASVADGDQHKNIQHHLLHDAIIVTVSSSKVRWGLVGVQFSEVNLEAVK